MATSGSYDFSMNCNDIILEAFSDARILGQDQTPTADEITNARRRLNMIVKQWQGKADFARGLKVYSRKRIALFLAKGQQRYTVGPASTDARATEQYGRTTISANEAIGQTTISITSNTDAVTFPGTTVTMTNGDIVGIEQNDGTIHWSTISGTPASTMTIANALTVAAAAGNYVYWFTSRAQKFPVIEAAVLRDENLKDRPLGIYREVAQYEQLADKFADGDPNNILVEPLRINTAVTLDYQPNDVTKQVWMTVLYPAEDYDQVTDDVAFSAEWFRPLALQLGMDLWPKYKGGDIPGSLTTLRNEALAIAQNVNPQTTDTGFQPHEDGHA